MGKPVEPQHFGIKEIYCPANEADTGLDIVAVHGLNGDALKTWTSPKSKICWLNHPDLLPKYMKHARVLVWGYNANISSLKGKETSKDRVLQHAQTLIQDLHADRSVRQTIPSSL
ncbi:ribonuclease p mrp subunit protein [Venturia nashicola]|nr:ribonuclease p mrp subunit protein [Venturia nashicola]